jgi:hypothetical protein
MMMQSSILDHEAGTSASEGRYEAVVKEIMDIDLSRTTPIEALNLMHSIKEKIIK